MNIEGILTGLVVLSIGQLLFNVVLVFMLGTIRSEINRGGR